MADEFCVCDMEWIHCSPVPHCPFGLSFSSNPPIHRRRCPLSRHAGGGCCSSLPPSLATPFFAIRRRRRRRRLRSRRLPLSSQSETLTIIIISPFARSGGRVPRGDLWPPWNSVTDQLPSGVSFWAA